MGIKVVFEGLAAWHLCHLGNEPQCCIELRWSLNFTIIQGKKGRSEVIFPKNEMQGQIIEFDFLNYVYLLWWLYGPKLPIE